MNRCSCHHYVFNSCITFTGEVMQCGFWPLTSWFGFSLMCWWRNYFVLGNKEMINSTFETNLSSHGRRWWSSRLHLVFWTFPTLFRPTIITWKHLDIDVMINVSFLCNVCSVKLTVIPVNGRVWETGNISSLELVGPRVGFYSLCTTFAVCFLRSINCSLNTLSHWVSFSFVGEMQLNHMQCYF